MAQNTVLSSEDHARIAEAVRQAEKATSGEIHCVVARRSDDYFYPSAFFAALTIMVATTIATLVVDTGWLAVPAVLFPAAALAALLTALALLKFVPGLRILMVPRSLRYRRASANAVAQFLSHNIHATSGRTGVLIFVSLAEQYAEIVADSGIDAKVAQESWNAVIADLTAKAAQGRLADGFVAAIEAVGAELAHHFPAGADDRNELDDHLVEI